MVVKWLLMFLFSLMSLGILAIPYSFLRNNSVIAGNGLLNNLVAYYDFEESGNNIGIDAHSNNDLDEVGGTWTSVSGIITNSRKSIGVSTYLANTTPSPGNFALSFSRSFTLTCWIKYADNLSSIHYIANVYLSGARNFDFYYSHANNESASILTIYPTDSLERLTITNDLPTNVWHFVGFSFNNANSNLTAFYAENGSTSVTFNAGVTITNISFEAVGNPFRLNHAVSSYSTTNWTTDEMAVWHKALSTNEINAVLNNGVGLPYSSFTL